jgi:hypothetical protein
MSNNNDDVDVDDECCICMQPMSLPWKSSACTHLFCFVCLKAACGMQQQRGEAPTCPMCRAPIDANELNRASISASNANTVPDGQALWFYRGRTGGWWQFETRQCVALEELWGIWQADPVAYDPTQHPLQIGAAHYLYDFASATQTSTVPPGPDGLPRQRRIARAASKQTLDVSTATQIKGVGGVRVLSVAKAAAAAPLH